MEWNGMEWEGIFQFKVTDSDLVPLPDYFSADQKIKHIIKGIV